MDDAEREFLVSVRRGRKWVHLRVKDQQTGQVVREKFALSDPGWWVNMSGFIVGFMGEAPTALVPKPSDE